MLVGYVVQQLQGDVLWTAPVLPYVGLCLP
jgi:hypothetical protein